MPDKPRIAFFGTPAFAVTSLEALQNAGLSPALVITMPDRPQGRGLKTAPPPAKVWAGANNVKVLQPEKMDDALIEALKKEKWDLFVTAAYGKFLPKTLLSVPIHGTLNIHPSLLPKFRGPSPIEGALLAGEHETGVSIMEVDEEMDHGPVVTQEKIEIGADETADTLEKILAELGGKLLARIIPDYLEGKIKPRAQEHEKATLTKKLEKEDARIDLDDNASLNYRKYRAFHGRMDIYFSARHHGKELRVIIKEAALKNGEFKIKRVLPEGGRVMEYTDFLRGQKDQMN